LDILLILDGDHPSAQQEGAISKLTFDGGDGRADHITHYGWVVRGSDRHNDRHMAAAAIPLDDRGGCRGRLALSVPQERDVVAPRL
jgi:hypothetical protein